MTFTLTSDTGALRTVTDAVGQDEPDASLFWSSLDSPVCVAGDWHGDARWATAALDVAADPRVEPNGRSGVGTHSAATLRRHDRTRARRRSWPRR